MDLQLLKISDGFLMSLHCQGQWLQLGRDGGEHGWRKERREHVSSERVKGVFERFMGLFGIEDVVGHLLLFEMVL